MRVSIEPISAVPAQLLREHLLHYGFPPEIIEWKYFDRRFSPGRERGYTWLKSGRVQGIIGMIPFQLRGRSGEAADCAWTCDWFIESAERNPGVGVFLLKEALNATGLLTTVGGNEATERLVPRMASHTVADASLEMTLPLRIGGTQVFQRVEARMPLGPAIGLARVPVRRLPRLSRSEDAVYTESSVAPAIGGLLDGMEHEDWAPGYDASYVEWQIGRCPALESATCYAAGSPVRAGTVFWRQRANGRHWRMALWMRRGAEHDARIVVDETIRQAARQGGQSLSVVTAQADGQSRQVFTAAGFRPTGRAFPLYVLARNTAPMSSLSRMSYLDSDMAYRF